MLFFLARRYFDSQTITNTLFKQFVALFEKANICLHSFFSIFLKHFRV